MPTQRSSRLRSSPRLRRRGCAAWRSWHAALMSFSILGAVVAVGGVVAGVLLGVASGPVFYRAFNVVIVTLTAFGLVLIDRKIWHGARTPTERRGRLWFNALVIAATGAVVTAQA